jgi:hypothetical protein
MRLYKDTIAFRLAVDIAWYGNVSYRTLKLYPYDYESTKDALQKLIRMGYVSVIKAKKSKSLRQSIKVLHITSAGRKAVDEAYFRLEVSPPSYPAIAYQSEKAYRASLISEAAILIHKSGCDSFISSHNVKRALEQNVRGSDSIKYSRFIGFWVRPDRCSVVYHYGNRNMLLRENGERNARQAARQYSPAIDVLIFGDSMDTLRAILDYSIWLCRKSQSQRKSLKKVIYHVDPLANTDHVAMFLPVSQTVMPVIRMCITRLGTQKSKLFTRIMRMQAVWLFGGFWIAESSRG